MTDLDERIRRSIAPATSPSQFALLAVLDLVDDAVNYDEAIDAGYVRDIIARELGVSDDA